MDHALPQKKNLPSVGPAWPEQMVEDLCQFLLGKTYDQMPIDPELAALFAIQILIHTRQIQLPNIELPEPEVLNSILDIDGLAEYLGQHGIVLMPATESPVEQPHSLEQQMVILMIQSRRKRR